MGRVIQRRWRIKKIQDGWHIHTKKIEPGASWRFHNYYRTFEEAREQVVRTVDLYTHLERQLENNKRDRAQARNS